MTKPVYHNIEQNTDLWLEVRAGHITASPMNKLTKTPGKLGIFENDYATQIALEQFGYTLPEKNLDGIAAVDNGNTQEANAVLAYELETLRICEPGGFVSLGDLGVSPDALVGSDGQLEVKAPEYKNHFKVVLSGLMDPQYVNQVQHGLKVTGRAWCDFVSYCPTFKSHPLVIVRVFPDPVIQKFLDGKIALLREKILMDLAGLKARSKS